MTWRVAIGVMNWEWEPLRFGKWSLIFALYMACLGSFCCRIFAFNSHLQNHTRRDNSLPTRFVRNLHGAATPEARAIIETKLGEEAQVDYGTGRWCAIPTVASTGARGCSY
jgi:hypothetical protein